MIVVFLKRCLLDYLIAPRIPPSPPPAKWRMNSSSPVFVFFGATLRGAAKKAGRSKLEKGHAFQGWKSKSNPFHSIENSRDASCKNQESRFPGSRVLSCFFWVLRFLSVSKKPPRNASTTTRCDLLAGKRFEGFGNKRFRRLEMSR